MLWWPGAEPVGLACFLECQLNVGIWKAKERRKHQQCVSLFSPLLRFSYAFSWCSGRHVGPTGSAPGRHNVPSAVCVFVFFPPSLFIYVQLVFKKAESNVESVNGVLNKSQGNKKTFFKWSIWNYCEVFFLHKRKAKHSQLLWYKNAIPKIIVCPPKISDRSAVPFAPNCAVNESLLHLAMKRHFS